MGTPVLRMSNGSAEPSVTEQIHALLVADAWLRWEAERVD
jgi:hypothetical protein